jgi:hypothetical protein
MPPWKWVMSDSEIYKVVFYVQSFSTPDDYNSKWAPQYTDTFGKNLKSGSLTHVNLLNVENNPVVAIIMLSAVVLWNVKHRQLMKFLECVKRNRVINTGGSQKWI